MSGYRFEVRNHAIVAFVAALTLGTLEAMRSGEWPLEAGISTLGRPIFQNPLRDALPPPLLAVLDVADELSALQQLRGTPAAMAKLDQLIAGVRAVLADAPSSFWYAAVRR